VKAYREGAGADGTCIKERLFGGPGEGSICVDFPGIERDCVIIACRVDPEAAETPYGPTIGWRG
jgi:hypothetical protein